MWISCVYTGAKVRTFVLNASASSVLALGTLLYHNHIYSSFLNPHGTLVAISIYYFVYFYHRDQWTLILHDHIHFLVSLEDLWTVHLWENCFSSFLSSLDYIEAGNLSALLRQTLKHKENKTPHSSMLHDRGVIRMCVAVSER